MPTINHTITVTINNINRTSLLLKDSLYIHSSIANKGDSASFTLRDDTGSFKPLDWDEVIISVNGTAVFGGYIINRQATGVGAGSNKVAHWSIECKDWTVIFDQLIVNYGYADSVDTDIIRDLFDRYLATDDFDVFSEVGTVDSDIDIFFENVTFREALNTLAATAKANWHVAPDKTVYWYSPISPANAAFTIDTVSPNNSTTFDVLADTLQYAVDATTIVNRVRIIGGEEQVGKYIETFGTDGTQRRFGPLAQKPGSIWLVTYVISGVTQYAYASNIGYQPEDNFITDGGDFEVLANLDEQYVFITTASGALPDAATNVEVTYYGLQQVDITVDDETSQSEYGRVFEQVIYDESFNTASATKYAENILEEYAFGRETISFEVTEYGLLPGRLISINSPIMGITSTYNDALALENRSDLLLLEDNSSYLMLENYGESRNYLIQEITIRTVVTGANQFMVVASATCGKYIPTLFDSLNQSQQFSAGVGRLPAKRNVGALDRLSNNLGEIVAGRATFTDGGTAAFSWDNYHDHTGVVIGLEDNDVDPYGAMYILQDGNVKAKVGRMDGLAAVGGVTPSGWGIWTQNGYFSGVIAASQMIGGTIATTTLPINSSNPGVYMTSAGLFAYGTLGLTFALPTDPAQRPIFSSGTILNTVYEVTTASVLRTGTVNPRIQIDNSGIFAYDTGGTLRFSVDVNTGRLTASQGTFSGSVTASQISGGTVTGGLVSGGTVSGAVFTGGTVTQGTISAATISAATISGGTVTGSQISGVTITGGQISGGTVTGALLSGGTVSLSGGTLTLSASGINNNQSGTAGVYSDTNPLFIRLNTNGTVIGYTGMYVSGVTAISYTKIGLETSPFLAATHEVRVAGHPFSSYDYMRLYIDGSNGFYFDVEGANRMIVNNDIIAGANVIADLSSNNRTLGDSTHGFRYLYLKDDNGNVRRVSINSSGVLTVT